MSNSGGEVGADQPKDSPSAGQQPCEESPEGTAAGKGHPDDAPASAEGVGTDQPADFSPTSDPAGGILVRRLRRVRKAFLQLAYKTLLKLPSFERAVKRRYLKKVIAQWAEQTANRRGREDAEANAATRLPSGEQALVPMIWLAEVFTPTTIESLVKGLRGLAARMEKSLLSPTDDLGEWVLSTRRKGGFAYRSLLYVTPQVSPIAGPRVVDKLPPGIRYVHLQVQTLTSTVTVLIATFWLDDDWEHGLEKILEQDRSVKVEMDRQRLTFTIPDAGKQKADAVDDWRRKLHANAARWMAERFPGFFHRVAPDQVPSIGLLLTGSYAPWQEVPRRTTPTLDWKDILDIVSWRGYWQGRGDFLARLNLSTRDGRRHSLSLAVSQGDLIVKEGGLGERDLSEALSMLDITIPFFLAGWSLTALLQELEEQISDIQDATDRVSREKSSRALEQVQQQLLRAGLDSRIVANDIAQHSGDLMWRHQGPDFIEVLPSSFKRKPGDSLVMSLIKGQSETGERVVQLEKDLREIISTNADLASASANLRLQRGVFWLTIISVLVAIIAAGAAVIAIERPSSPAVNYPSPPAQTKRPSAQPSASIVPSPARYPTASGSAR